MGVDIFTIAKHGLFAAMAIIAVLSVYECNKDKDRIAALELAQQTGEATIAQLRDDNAQLMQALEKWKNDYTEIEKSSAEQKRQLACLENENEEIRAALHTVVPDAAWSIMFPTGPACTNKD